MPTNMLTAFLAALMSALAATLVAVAAEWLKQRGQAARARRDAAQAAGQLEFLSAWLTVRERLTQLHSESERILFDRQLERLQQETEDAWSRERIRSPVRAAVDRFLILGVRRDDRLVQFARALYWLALGWLVIVGIPGFVERLLRIPPNESWPFYFGYVSRGVADELVLPILCLIVSRWAVGRLIRRRGSEPST